MKFHETRGYRKVAVTNADANMEGQSRKWNGFVFIKVHPIQHEDGTKPNTIAGA